MKDEMLMKRSLGRSLTWVFSDCYAQGCSCGRPTSSGLQTSYYTSCTSTWDHEWWYINTCTFADGMRKRTLSFFFCHKQRLKQIRYWSPTRVFSPIPTFLLFSGSPHLCLQPPETYLQKDSFLVFGFISKLSIFLQLYLFCFPSPGLNTPCTSAICTTCRWRRSSQSLTLGTKTMIIFGGRK